MTTPPTFNLANIGSFPAEDGGLLDLWDVQRGSQWLFAVGFELWHVWNGTHWQPDPGGYMIAAEIETMLNAWRRMAIQRKNAATTKAEISQWAEYTAAGKRTRARIASIEAMARARRAVPADSLDAADVLNLQNGTFHFETGTLTPHAPADRLTYCLPYNYDPAAVAPNWELSLSRIDPENVDFLQEFSGYCLTPDCKHEIAVWFHGLPGGGKSTFLGGLEAILGPKAMVLGLVDIERNRFALANLPGKTLAVATEQPGDYLASTHILNAIVSGEPVAVDRKFAPAITITPRAKLLWAMNELPRVRGTNDGIFRRVKIVELPPIPQHERRPEMKAAIQAEAAGILNWAMAGLQRLRARGRFVIPAAIEAASLEFATKNDIPTAFVDECCDVAPNLSVQSQQLYNRYWRWCNDTGHKPQSSTSIANEWRRLGFTKRKTPGGMVWDGVAIKP